MYIANRGEAASNFERIIPMRFYSVVVFGVAVSLTACGQNRTSTTPAPALPQPGSQPAAKPTGTAYVGFDRNVYPGDDRLDELRQHFAFASYWLTVPPGERANSWLGKRKLLVDHGFGFLILANGKLDAEIKHAKVSASRLGAQDATEAIASAKQEGFPEHTIIFLDQEEGGRLLPEQTAYFFGWTEAVAASAYRPGAYLSGQKDSDGRGPDGKPLFITTAQDVRENIARQHLHDVALWVYDDTCPPAPGCTLSPPPLTRSGTLDAVVWQYAQSPRRPELTRSCAKTYAVDGNCYAGISKDLFLDLNVAALPDPSHGR